MRAVRFGSIAEDRRRLYLAHIVVRIDCMWRGPVRERSGQVRAGSEEEGRVCGDVGEDCVQTIARGVQQSGQKGKLR